MNRPAVLALPGLSTTTLLANLTNIMSLSDGHIPVILVDRYDYERLRGRHLKGIGNNQKAPYLGMIYDELERRGIIRLIDYSKYYPKKVQQEYLQQNQKLVEEMPEWIHRQIAVEGVKGWKRYGRGAYQEPVRAALGEDEDMFAASRREEEGLLRRMKRGGGDPVSWNEKLFNKSAAALEICHRADRHMNLDVKCVVGGPEHEIIVDLINTAHAKKSTDFDTSILDIDPGDITTEIPHSKGSDPVSKIGTIEPEMSSETRDMYDTISKVASDIVGRGGDKWVLVGTSLVIPLYSEIFNTNRIHAQVKGKFNTDDLASETRQAITTLDSGTEERDPSNIIEYEAEKISEEHDKIQIENLEAIINQAIAMSNYSVELDSLIDENEFSQAALFTAASILSDPIHRYEVNDVYQHSLDLSARLNLSSIGTTELEEVGMEASGSTWGDNFDWFEDINRER